MEIKRCYDTIIGASVVRNQLARPISSAITVNGVTLTPNSDGSITMNGTASNGGFLGGYEPLSLTIDHVYALIGTGSVISRQFYTAIGDSNAFASTIKKAQSTSGATGIRSDNGTVYSNNKVRLIVIDLTALLGSSIADYIYSLESATAGSGIAKLRSWGFLRGYQAYNAGSIESVEVTGKKVTGFNAWDEEWESGYYDIADGSEKSSSSWVRSKELISVVPNTEYTFKANTSESVGGIGYILFYNGNGQYINSYIQMLSSLYGETGQQFTVPSNACYMGFYMNVAWQTVGICINLSSDRNGEYEAYTSQTYDYGSDTLNGIFKLDANNNLFADGDRKTSDGVITRKYGVVDLGTLTWGISNNGNYFQGELPLSAEGSYSGLANVICSKYPTISTPESLYNGTVDKVMMVNTKYISSTKSVFIRDSAYSDAASFKAAMSGVMLVYELATPTTEQSTPFTSPQVCYPDGTEEYITSNGVPVGHETRYEL